MDLLDRLEDEIEHQYYIEENHLLAGMLEDVKNEIEKLQWIILFKDE